MCQARVLVDGEEVMEDVVFVELTQEGVLVSRFFEKPVLIAGSLRSIDLLKHTVNLETDSETSTRHEEKT
jgi:predicted RNA-binding protein